MEGEEFLKVAFEHYAVNGMLSAHLVLRVGMESLTRVQTAATTVLVALLGNTKTAPRPPCAPTVQRGALGNSPVTLRQIALLHAL